MGGREGRGGSRDEQEDGVRSVLFWWVGGGRWDIGVRRLRGA